MSAGNYSLVIRARFLLNLGHRESVLHRFIIAFLFLFLSGAAMAAPPPIYMNEQDMPILIRALVASSTRATPSKSQPQRNNPTPAPGGGATYSSGPSWTETEVLNKSQYVNYLKNGNAGNRADCQDRYNKYNDFFRHDSSLSGTIYAKEGGASAGRLDTVCDFLGYAHWCFALGFAYAVRDLDDPARAGGGNRCFTYQEFCTNRNKALDTSKIDEYLSRLIDEIMFYHTSIKNTSKNTVATTTETRQGPSLVTSTSWRVYDTDSWVREQVSASEMTRLLCR